MSAYEERQALMRTAQELLDEFRTVSKRVYAITNMLLTAADGLIPAATAEISDGVKVKKEPIHLPVDLEPVYTPRATEALALPDVTITKRKCGLCRERGHIARNCPNAHKVKAAKKAQVEKRDVKKTREAKLTKGKRACSVCRKPGHRAKNCPDA